MAKKGLTVNLVTPQGPIAACETDAVLAPGRLGQFQVLTGHVPFLSELHAGALVCGEATKKLFFAVGPGFLEVERDGKVQILAEKATSVADIDKDAVAKDHEEAKAKLAKWSGALDAEYRTLKARLDWAQAQLDAVKLSGN